VKRESANRSISRFTFHVSPRAVVKRKVCRSQHFTFHFSRFTSGSRETSNVKGKIQIAAFHVSPKSKTLIMKNILSTFLVSFFAIGFCVTAHAQQTSSFSAEKYAAKLNDWMKTNLQLTSEQIPKVEEINLRYAKRLEALKAKTIPRRQKLDILKADDKDKEKELKNVFTVDQFKKYQAKKNEIKKQMKENIKKKRAGG
jgi:hypothetical protein